ncbi:50S ribosomal protein L11 methyltransferase [Peptoniphilus sp. GNH]|nr:50S ribosomal protein L11 methyltransferase [Peptoniphilus sp. GNH]
MKYTEIKFTCPDERAEEIENFLYMLDIYDFSSKSLKLLNDIKTTPWAYNLVDEEVLSLPKDTSVYQVFFNEDESEMFCDVYKKLEGLGVDNLLVETRDDCEWKDKWKDYFHTLKFNKIKIIPSWENEKMDKYSILMDPGMAFGSGTHETTRLSIKMLEKFVKNEDKVLDIGSGSGILALAAKKLGADKVVGIDIDPDSVRVARENASINGEDIEFITGDLAEDINEKYNVIVSNIIAEIIVDLIEDLPRILEKGGLFLCSGILFEKEDMLKNELKKAGFEIIHIRREGDWLGIGARYV